MKVAIVINEINVRGGTHKQVLRLCQYLRAEGVEFQLFCKYCDLDKTYPEFSDFNIISLKRDRVAFTEDDSKLSGKIRNYYFYIKEQKQLYDLIPDDVEIINVHDNGLPWLLYWSGKRKNCSVIWQINDLPSCFRVGAASVYDDTFGFKVKRFLYRVMVKRIDRITVNVTKNKVRVNNCLHRNADVLYCGVDRNSKLREHRFNDIQDTIRILSVGVFYSYRNYETLIAVIQKLRRENINAQLDIIGSTELDPKYSKKIEQIIFENNLNEYIHVHGQVDENTYINLFDKSTIFSFININQSWGLAVFEAMSCGLPVIVSESVGATELLHNGVDSIIVDPLDVASICDGIKKLINDKNFFNMLSSNEIEETKKYTWNDLYCSKMLEIFKEERSSK